MNWEKYRPVFVPGAVIFLAGLSLLILLPKQISHLIQMNQELKKIKEEIEESKTKYLLVSSLDQETLNQQAQLALTAVPEEKNVPLILQALRESLNRAGFIIKTLKFAPGEISKPGTEEAKKSQKTIEELPLEIEIVGPVSRLEELFSSIEQSLPLFQINSAEVTGSQKITSRALIKLQLMTFYSPPSVSQQPDKIALKDLVLNEQEIKLLEQLSQFRPTELSQEKVTLPAQPSAPSGRTNPFVFP